MARRFESLCLILALGAAAPALAQDEPTWGLWVGARAGAVLPFGELGSGQPGWGDYLGPGGSAQLDLGTRIDRTLTGFAFGEYDLLSTGRNPSAEMVTGVHANGPYTGIAAGERSASVKTLGLGMQGVRRLGRIGIAGELALAYRRVDASWADGSSLSMEGVLDLRLGLGVQLRFNDWTASQLLASVTLPMFHGSGELISGNAAYQLPELSNLPPVFSLSVAGHYEWPGIHLARESLIHFLGFAEP